MSAALAASTFAVAFIATALATPIVRMLVRRFGIVAPPAADRWHKHPTALMGGVAIFAGCVVGVGAMWFLLRSELGALAVPRSTLGIVGAAALMFAAGVADDLSHFRPATKLSFQIAAAALLMIFGTVFPLTPWTTVNVLFTVFWFIGVTNALNLLDNMDGVAAGVSGIAALFLGITLFLHNQPALAGLCIALSGAAAGFLPFNFSRASIFMGDSGSLFIGALLAGLAAAFPSGASPSVVSALFVPAIIVIVPIIDTVLVSLTRTLAGLPVTVGGRDHTAHRLVAMGLTERQVALLLYLFAAIGGGVALLLQALDTAVALSTGAVFLGALAVAAAYLSKLHVYQYRDELPGVATVVVSNLLHKRRAAEVLLDVVAFAVAYHAAYLLRWDNVLPPDQVANFHDTLPIAIACNTLAFFAAGIYRGDWHRLSLSDVHRLARAIMMGGVLTFAVCAFLFPRAPLSRATFVITSLLIAALTLSMRASFRSLDRVRNRLRPHGRICLIYGAGRCGELAFREMMQNERLDFRPVGFIDDDPKRRGRMVLGHPVIGSLADLPDALEATSAAAVVVAIRDLPPARLEQLLELTAPFATIEVVALRISFEAPLQRWNDRAIV
jgi:UDP-GlcNAc:undecaprenyl-phosphate/decaprenyl-phosphate GlcNAc-1-phosphate transferase